MGNLAAMSVQGEGVSELVIPVSYGSVKVVEDSQACDSVRPLVQCDRSPDPEGEKIGDR